MSNDAGLAGPPGADPNGFALVAVVWLAGLIAAGFAVSVRLNVFTHAASLHGQQLEAAADGLTQLTAFRLAAEPTPTLPSPGTALACRWSESISAEVLIQDQCGLIDINLASTNLISRLAAGAGAMPDQAQAIAAAFGDFLDPDSEASVGGSEPDVYPGMGFGPKNGFFDAVEVLDQIPGMTEPLYRAMLPHVTIYSLQAGLDPVLMTPTLKGLLGFSPSGETPPDLANNVPTNTRQVYGIDARVATKAGDRYRRLTIDKLQPGNLDRPFTTLTWQRGGDFEMGPPASSPFFETESSY